MYKNKIEIQYFKGFPNAEKMIERVGKAIQRLKIEFDYTETLVDTVQKAEKLKFRGSPTLLIDGIDFEYLPEPEVGNISCRYYSDGLPEIEQIINKIKKGNQ